MESSRGIRFILKVELFVDELPFVGPMFSLLKSSQLFILILFFLACMMICFQVEVTFVDRNLPNDSGFCLTLSMQMTFAEMATAVAKHLKTDPSNLQVQPLL